LYKQLYINITKKSIVQGADWSKSAGSWLKKTKNLGEIGKINKW
jgi:hypothetical protein